MKDKIPKIPESEWEVMKVVWDHSPRTSQEIIDALSGPMQWSAGTIKTLINRLLKKGALTFDKAGREYLYSPAVSREKCVRAENQSFLKRVHNGAIVPLIVNLVEDKKLSKAEIDQLRKFFEEKAK